MAETAAQKMANILTQKTLSSRADLALPSSSIVTLILPMCSLSVLSVQTWPSAQHYLHKAQVSTGTSRQYRNMSIHSLKKALLNATPHMCTGLPFENKGRVPSWLLCLSLFSKSLRQSIKNMVKRTERGAGMDVIRDSSDVQETKTRCLGWAAVGEAPRPRKPRCRAAVPRKPPRSCDTLSPTHASFSRHTTRKYHF